MNTGIQVTINLMPHHPQSSSLEEEMNPVKYLRFTCTDGCPLVIGQDGELSRCGNVTFVNQL